MENSFKNNTLLSLRYSVTQVYNANSGWHVGAHHAMDIKYSSLIEFHRAQLIRKQAGSENIQVFRNHCSTLNAYLAYNKKTTDGFVGRELRGAFEEKLNEFLAALGQPPKTLSDKRSHLRLWKQSFDILLNQQHPSEAQRLQSSTFNQALCDAVAMTGIPPKTLARKCSISPSAMQRWMNGAEPNARTLPSLRRLEKALGLKRGTLEDLLQQGKAMADSNITISNDNIPYRARLKTLLTDSYRVKDSQFTSEFRSEWQNLLRYKTATHTPLARRNGSTWRLLPIPAIHGNISPLARINGQGCASAQVLLSQLYGFFGYLQMNEARGGLALSANIAQTLASLVVPEYIDGFMQFKKNRSDGKTHEGHAVFARNIASLVNRDFGYLRQMPELFQKLSIAMVNGRSWEALCDETMKVVKSWVHAATDVSRDPSLPIQPLLNLDEPLEPVLRAVLLLDQEAAKSLPGSLEQARHKRDALLLSLALVNPLRIRTLALITHQGNNGNLYQRGREWRLRFKGDDFKNEYGSRQDDYDATVPGLNERIEEYLYEYLPTLKKKAPSSIYLFPSTHSSSGKHNGLDKVIVKITKRYIPEVISFGPHAIRHLVASAHLKIHPKDFLTVAELLHDNLVTVMENYAHLSKDDAISRYSQHLSEIRSRLKLR